MPPLPPPAAPRPAQRPVVWSRWCGHGGVGHGSGRSGARFRFELEQHPGGSGPAGAHPDYVAFDTIVFYYYDDDGDDGDG